MEHVVRAAAVVAAVQFLSKKKVAPADNMKAPLLQKSQEEQEASAKLSAGKAALKWKTKVLGMEAAHLVSVLFLSSDLILYLYPGRHLQRHIVATAGSSCC